MVSRSWIPVSSPHGKFMSSDVVGREIRRHTRAKIRASSRVGRGKWWLESSGCTASVHYPFPDKIISWLHPVSVVIQGRLAVRPRRCRRQPHRLT